MEIVAPIVTDVTSSTPTTHNRGRYFVDRCLAQNQYTTVSAENVGLKDLNLAIYRWEKYKTRLFRKYYNATENNWFPKQNANF